MSGTGEFDTMRIKLYSENISIDQTGFDPENIKKYYNRVFKTVRGSHYLVTPDGRISGRPSIEEAKIELIGGVDPEIYYQLRHDLGWCCRPKKLITKGELTTLIRDFGQEINEGLMLVLLINPIDEESEKEYERIGMITSPIDKIIPLEYIH